VLGQSPKRYLFALRMRLAAAALAEGRKSIAEIASSVGYESEPAFHRAFHRKLGLTPGVYGRRAKRAE
jgi:transcriptional regulator GlxA family with amidase domain